MGTGTKQLNSCSPGKCWGVMGKDGWNGAGKGRAWNLQQEFSFSCLGIFTDFYFPVFSLLLKWLSRKLLVEHHTPGAVTGSSKYIPGLIFLIKLNQIRLERCCEGPALCGMLESSRKELRLNPWAQGKLGIGAHLGTQINVRLYWHHILSCLKVSPCSSCISWEHLILGCLNQQWE